ncbi:hypothetical protein K470DRAFT_244817 [Piedraia hortae CBS 480.64]|uniref:Histone acetyltransferase ESA1 n=1 Tax=Piedraia hortae CBS 480.64 TaxID=1314780 RepID=A0A6A7C498_9PEZI|nr:hypothetical protein K470DRAFT_244817 [Piedraia hortae CBS 480.64]
MAARRRDMRRSRRYVSAPRQWSKRWLHDAIHGRYDPNGEQEGEKRKAEILAIQTRKGRPTFYVHYQEFNKRLDEWIPADRLDLSQPVDWPVAEKNDAKNKQKSSKAQPSKAQPARSARARSNTATREPSQAPEDNNLVDVREAAVAAKAAPDHAPYTREEEIEKLRTGGSMTQNQTEISRVRNLEKIQMGDYEVEPWYFSPYPPEFAASEMVYICEFCLSYFDSTTRFRRHRQKCTLFHPPGNEIYRDETVSFFELDGRRQRRWCRNLCLLSKLFLDHKTLYYDVDPFLFYCMTSRDERGHHLLGYFSKEKESAEGYNVACILTLPQHQRKGYGRLLIQFSYELSKIEGKLGSPEKPLSDLGLLSYRAYWQETIVDLLVRRQAQRDPTMSVEEISQTLAMTQNDVLHTLQALNMLRYSNKNYIIVLTKAVVEQRERILAKEKSRGTKVGIDPSKLIEWKPPVFNAAARTWNW